MTDDQYWPFFVSEEDKQLPEVAEKIEWLERVCATGFKGYRFGGNNYGAESTARTGIIIQRGRRGRWELRLTENGSRRLIAFVSSFQVAGKALLDWLKGRSVQEILVDIEEYLIVMPGLKTRYVVYEAKDDTKML